MRIAIFTDTYLPDVNGVAQSIDRFCKLLADDGNELIIFCPKNGRYKDKPYPNIQTKRYLSITYPSYKDIKIAIPFILNVVSDLKEFNPDVVHIQTPMGIGWIALWATKILKMKNIQTYHSYIPDFMIYLKPKPLYPFKRLVNYIASSRLIKNLIEEDITNGRENGKLKAYLKDKVEDAIKKTAVEEKQSRGEMTDRFAWEYTRVFYNRADLVLTPSKVLADALIKNEVKSEVDVLSNGIEFNLFKKKSDYLVQNKLIHVGRLGFEKHVEVPIKALKFALKKNPKITLDIFGDGPARKSYEKLVKQLNLTKNVRFWGFVKREELFTKYSEYDAFITGSTMETQGIVLLEAMAAGLPVIAVRELAVPEIVFDSKNGYLSAPFKEKEMAENIVKLFSDPKKIQKFGQASLAVAEFHEITKCKERLEGFYRRIANVPSIPSSLRD